MGAINVREPGRESKDRHGSSGNRFEIDMKRGLCLSLGAGVGG